jgi:hypothetical protein
MSHDPLELTQAQVSLVMAGAETLRPEWRQRFLASVQDRLLRFDRKITDSEVIEAIAGVRWTFTEGTVNDDDG